MFSPFNANGTATDALRIACRRAAEHEARRAQHDECAPARAVAARRATTTMLLGGWLVALFGTGAGSGPRG